MFTIGAMILTTSIRASYFKIRANDGDFFFLIVTDSKYSLDLQYFITFVINFTYYYYYYYYCGGCLDSKEHPRARLVLSDTWWLWTKAVGEEEEEVRCFGSEFLVWPNARQLISPWSRCSSCPVEFIQGSIHLNTIFSEVWLTKLYEFNLNIIIYSFFLSFSFCFNRGVSYMQNIARGRIQEILLKWENIDNLIYNWLQCSTSTLNKYLKTPAQSTEILTENMITLFIVILSCNFRKTTTFIIRLLKFVYS